MNFARIENNKGLTGIQDIVLKHELTRALKNESFILSIIALDEKDTEKGFILARKNYKNEEDAIIYMQTINNSLDILKTEQAFELLKECCEELDELGYLSISTKATKYNSLFFTNLEFIQRYHKSKVIIFENEITSILEIESMPLFQKPIIKIKESPKAEGSKKPIFHLFTTKYSGSEIYLIEAGNTLSAAYLKREKENHLFSAKVENDSEDSTKLIIKKLNTNRKGDEKFSEARTRAMLNLLAQWSAERGYTQVSIKTPAKFRVKDFMNKIGFKDSKNVTMCASPEEIIIKSSNLYNHPIKKPSLTPRQTSETTAFCL